MAAELARVRAARDPVTRRHLVGSLLVFAPRAYGADYRTFRVHEVLEDSPATDAGIAEGDIITAIDGSAAATFTLSEIIDLLEKPVARELTIRREGRTFKTTLTPRRLI